MRTGAELYSWVVVAAVLAGIAAPVAADAPPAKEVPADVPSAVEGAPTEEQIQAERLRRARERHEREQLEYGKRRDGELARQNEIVRLQMQMTTLEREESMLSGQLLSTEQQILYSRSDPADFSANARRGELQSRLSYLRSQLQQKTTERQSLQRQLENARLRPPRR